MVLYPPNIEEKIGFLQIREMLIQSCMTPVGRELVEQLSIMDDVTQIQNSIELASELRLLIEQGNRPPEVEFEPIEETIKYSRIEGSMLSMEQLFNLLLVLRAAEESSQYIRSNQEECPQLFNTYKDLKIDRPLIKHLDRCIDERGQLRDSASKELQRLRRQVVKTEQLARNRLNQHFSKAKNDGFTPDGSSISIRSGRLVLPVLSEHKKKVRGLVHDMSSTGSTLFIEPEEVLELNNELREYQYLERREINRILGELTSEVRDSEDLAELSSFLGSLDFLRSKSHLSIQLGASKPNISNDENSQWLQARHPLLDLSFKTQNKSVISQNLSLDQENRIILISGPNAGGKSVCLKTLGLIQYMMQCGLEVPLDEISKMEVFSKLFIDIGDEQSLENDLSTYSSHLLNMKYFMENSDSRTLVLIDEFGTGTDPDYGGAIAEAVLEVLIQKETRGMITTHYGNLKQFAENNQGVVNGAMQFDSKILEPLYRLEIGKPGSSFALEIATKIGLNTKSIEKAKKIIGEDKVQLDELIASLEKEKVDLEQKLQASNQLNQQLENNIDQYRLLREKLDDQKADIINLAKDEAKSLLKQANVQIEKTIREIKESSADKVKTRETRETLKEFEKKVIPKFPKPKKARKRREESSKILPGEIKVNDTVRIVDQGTKGTVIRIMGKEAEILMGSLRSTLKLKRLERIGGAPKQSKIKKTKPGGVDLNQKMAAFSSDIDIRGKRVEEVLPELDKYIDNAIMFNASQLRIVHGKGNGILREVVRTHLKGYSEVKKMSDEHADRGGAGVTIVEMA